jgi:acyl-coenzyme A synthetase/AMP-(fatty) acid ligase
MSQPDAGSLWQRTTAAGTLDRRFLSDEHSRITLDVLAATSALGSREELRGASVLLLSKSQLSTALALLELDGVARRIVLCPADLDPRYLLDIMALSEATGVASEELVPELAGTGLRWAKLSQQAAPCRRTEPSEATEWILFTSGTTGRPKLVLHTLESLTGAIATRADGAERAVWSTFYDIRRYGGLQILLRALVAGGSMVFSSPSEPASAFLQRAHEAGVSHISGTPSHWRRAVMSPVTATFSPRYVRLSGETADQAILDKLQEVFPRSGVAHAFASTEAGVAFDVGDGLAGFPAALIGANSGGVELRIQDGTLRIRSARTAVRYLGDEAGPIADPEGFVDTKDMVDLREGRYRFMGRKDGAINVGGLKVHPEEVEGVINRHPSVHLSLVKARRSPIVGAIIVADVVLTPPAAETDPKALEEDILKACRAALPWYKVPAALRFVPAVAVTPAGKLVRSGA